MLNWLLITSITLVSTTLLMFVSAYIAIFDQTAQFYEVSRDKVIFLSYTFNIFYLIISPIIFPWLKKHFTSIVKYATLGVAIGCTGRSLAGNNYQASLVFSIIVAISHVPIITAPYGLLGLFQPEKRGYASSIPLFVPGLGINFCILYGMGYVADESDIKIIANGVSLLNFIIAVVGVISVAATFILMNMLNNQIRQINDDAQDAQNNKSCVQQLRLSFKSYKVFAIVSICWGTILGVHWTYGGMFGVFLDGTGFTHKQVALIGLAANISSAVFSNLGNFISNRTKFSNISIIFYLNIFGFLASLFIQASTALPYQIFHSELSLTIAIIILRAGFSSFVSLALIELSSFGPSVLVSSVFFYVANAVNLGASYLTTIMSSTKSLGVLSFIVWVCITLVFIFMQKKSENISSKNAQMIQMHEQQMKSQNFQQKHMVSSSAPQPI